MREGEPARGFTTRAGRVLAVRTDGGALPCAEVVIAGGAWTPAIAAELGAEVGVDPIRGQILALTPQPMPVRHTIYGPDGYLKTKFSSYEICYNAVVQPGVVISSDNNVDCKKNHTLEVYDAASPLPLESWSDDDAVRRLFLGARAAQSDLQQVSSISSVRRLRPARMA